MIALAPQLEPFLDSIIDRINIGILIVNSRLEVVLWNHFMEINSGQSADAIIGRNLFESFPDLPRNVVENKIKSVFILKNFAFSSWEQRPYLFKFRHHRPVTGGIEYMYQDFTFIPIRNAQGTIEHVCITLADVTDTAIYQQMLKEALESLANAANHDGLTGVYNRHFLEESLAREFSRIKRYGGTMSLVMIDIDHFKFINDTHGHLVGDEVLRATAKRLEETLRQNDVLCRYGGEEFSLLLPETHIGGAHNLAERIRIRIAETSICHGNHAIAVTISAGIAEYHAEMTRYEDLIKAADDALYQAKGSRRNCVYCAPAPKTLESDSASG